MQPEEGGTEFWPAEAAQELYDDLVELDDRDDLAAQSPPAQAPQPDPPPRVPSARRRRNLDLDDIGDIIGRGFVVAVLVAIVFGVALPAQLSSIAYLGGWQIAPWYTGHDPVNDTVTAISGLVIFLALEVGYGFALKMLLSKG
jgi:hypothetical protein